MINIVLRTKYEVLISTRIEDRKDDAKCSKFIFIYLRLKVVDRRQLRHW